MNTIENRTNPRMIRIKQAAYVCQCLTGMSLVLGLFFVLAFLVGWHHFTSADSRIVISQNHIYRSPHDMPEEIFALFLVKVGVMMAANLALFALFRLYSRGILFSARNILLIRVLGYCTIINWVIDYLMQSALRDMALSMTSLFVGLIIIFVAWVMDEGRKIQEEQELTV